MLVMTMSSRQGCGERWEDVYILLVGRGSCRVDKGEKRWSTDLGHPVMASPCWTGTALYMSVMMMARSTPSTARRARSSGRTTSATRWRGEPAVASGRLYVATINADTFLHCIGGGSSHHSASSKDEKDEGGSAFGTFVTWFCVLIGLGVVAYAALTIGKPYLEEHGRLPVMQRRDALPGAGRRRTYAAPFVELQESMIDDKPEVAGLSSGHLSNRPVTATSSRR